jgi:hypothetical protein
MVEVAAAENRKIKRRGGAGRRPHRRQQRRSQLSANAG